MSILSKIEYFVQSIEMIDGHVDAPNNVVSSVPFSAKSKDN